MVVLVATANASLPKGCVDGAVAWYFFSFFVAVLSVIDWACTQHEKIKMADHNKKFSLAVIFFSVCSLRSFLILEEI